MSSTESSTRIGNLYHNLKEIEHEKNCLENKLHERRQKRRELEQMLENARIKENQVQDMKAKMLETLKVAQYKAAQLQNVADNLEESNAEKRKSIQELNKRINACKELQMQQVKSFEEELHSLTGKLRHARKFYVNENLKTELEDAYEDSETVKEKMENTQSEVTVLASDLENLKVKQDKTTDDGISLDARKTVWSMFHDENVEAKSVCAKIQNDVTTFKQQMHQA